MVIIEDVLRDDLNSLWKNNSFLCQAAVASRYLRLKARHYRLSWLHSLELHGSSDRGLREKMIFITPLLLFLPSCVSGTFVVNVTQTSYHAEENQNITLEWTFSTRRDTSLRSISIVCEMFTEIRRYLLFQLHQGVESPESQDPEFSGRVQWDKDVLTEGRLTLHVSRLRTSDSGFYLLLSSKLRDQQRVHNQRDTDSSGSTEKMILLTPLLLFLASCVSGTFVVNVTQASYQAEENQNITLEWTFSTRRDTSLSSISTLCFLRTETKTYVFHLYKGIEVPKSQDLQFAGRVQWDKDVLTEGRLTLHVSRLRTNDSGFYVCDILVIPGGNKSRGCWLNVTAAAELQTQRPPERHRYIWIYVAVTLTLLSVSAAVFKLRLTKRNNSEVELRMSSSDTQAGTIESETAFLNEPSEHNKTRRQRVSSGSDLSEKSF
ncbi:hypothetical protein NQZ68_018161 [Dissostichus eleginoides]|nr:hypothetical protein NQZ68_018161 [Dissostichus eleginoides]